MARKWEAFSDPGTPKIARLHVSMSQTGNIMLSRNAYEALGEPTHVEMLWEGDTGTIGLRSVPPRTLHAFKLYDPRRSGAWRFHALRFMVKHDIKLDYTIRFPTATMEDGAAAPRTKIPRPLTKICKTVAAE